MNLNRNLVRQGDVNFLGISKTSYAVKSCPSTSFIPLFPAQSPVSLNGLEIKLKCVHNNNAVILSVGCPPQLNEIINLKANNLREKRERLGKYLTKLFVRLFDQLRKRLTFSTILQRWEKRVLPDHERNAINSVGQLSSRVLTNIFLKLSKTKFMHLSVLSLILRIMRQ